MSSKGGIVPEKEILKNIANKSKRKCGKPEPSDNDSDSEDSPESEGMAITTDDIEVITIE